MTSVTIVARAVRNVSFLVLLAALLVLLQQGRVEAFPGCTPTANYSNYTVWYWGCELEWGDPCASFDTACGYDCYSYFSRTSPPIVYSCQSSPMGDGHWWLSWAECGCPE